MTIGALIRICKNVTADGDCKNCVARYDVDFCLEVLRKLSTLREEDN